MKKIGKLFPKKKNDTEDKSDEKKSTENKDGKENKVNVKKKDKENKKNEEEMKNKANGNNTPREKIENCIYLHAGNSVCIYNGSNSVIASCVVPHFDKLNNKAAEFNNRLVLMCN